jgi:hypothetical protein
LRFTWGEFGAFVRRVDRALDAAASSETEVELRQQVDQLREEVKAVAPPPKVTKSRGDTPAWFRDLIRTRATHTFKGRDSVTLTLRMPSSGASARYRCTVKTPAGDSWSQVAPPPLIAGFVVNVGVVYPDEFVGSPPLGPGVYEVEWRATTGEESEQATLAGVLVAAAMPPLATDAFSIPEKVAASSTESVPSG